MSATSSGSTQSDKPLRLLQAVPGKVYQRLIVRYPHQSDREFAFFYHEAALRLASTYSGRPIDDTILLPFLMLYRHGFELQLKNFIRNVAGLRRRHHGATGPDVDREAVNEKLQRDHGHNLAKLLHELLKHYNALELREAFPESVSKVVRMLHDADRNGTAFRYSGELPDSQDHADFPALAELLDEQLGLLSAVEDWVDELYAAVPDHED
ncbi:hypothetical protein ACVGOW_12930 [Pseudonocardia saturnea]